MTQWKISVGGEVHGPFTTDQLLKGIKTGKIQGDTEICPMDGDTWSMASEYPLIFRFDEPPINSEEERRKSERLDRERPPLPGNAAKPPTSSPQTWRVKKKVVFIGLASVAGLVLLIAVGVVVGRPSAKKTPDVRFEEFVRTVIEDLPLIYQDESDVLTYMPKSVVRDVQKTESWTSSSTASVRYDVRRICTDGYVTERYEAKYEYAEHQWNCLSIKKSYALSENVSPLPMKTIYQLKGEEIRQLIESANADKTAIGKAFALLDSCGDF